MLSARVDLNEDPVDLYRVWAPAARTLRVRGAGQVTVRLLGRAARAKKPSVLAASRNGVATYRNLYAEVRPAATRTADYTLRITAARR